MSRKEGAGGGQQGIRNKYICMRGRGGVGVKTYSNLYDIIDCQLVRCYTAGGSSTRFSLVGPAKVKHDIFPV